MGFKPPLGASPRLVQAKVVITHQIPIIDTYNSVCIHSDFKLLWNPLIIWVFQCLQQSQKLKKKIASHYSTDQPAAVASFRTWRSWQGSGLNDLPLQKYIIYATFNPFRSGFFIFLSFRLKIKPDKKELLAFFSRTLGF